MSEFIIRPNHSLSARGTIGAITVFALVLGLISIRLAYMGYWLIIPFLLLDLVAVAFAFYYIRKKCCIHETVKIDDKQLFIEHHELRNAQSWGFDLPWVQVKLQKHAHPWQPSRLLIGSHGKWIELASFLTDEERAALSNELKQTISKRLQYV